MQSFSKITCQQLRRDLDSVLAKYGVTAGLEFKVGSMVFSPTETSIKLTANIAGAPKNAEKALETWMTRYNLKEVNSRGDKLVEYQERRYKHPFIYINAGDGKRYKTSLDGVKRLGFMNA